MTDKQALNEIYTNLQKGERYGYFVVWNYYDNEMYRYPYFNVSLYKTGHGYFGYQNYGSSATKATKKDLEWILTTIFEETPKEFLITHITETQLKNCVIGLEKLQDFGN